MKTNLTVKDYSKLGELWEVSPTQVEAVTKRPIEPHNAKTSARRFRVTALQQLGIDVPYKFYAYYEKKIEVELNGSTYRLWVDADGDFPYQDAQSASECLRLALHQINDKVEE